MFLRCRLLSSSCAPLLEMIYSTQISSFPFLSFPFLLPFSPPFARIRHGMSLVCSGDYSSDLALTTRKFFE